MLKVIGYVSFGIAGLFLLLLLLLLLQNTKKKSLKVRKQIKGRRRFYGVSVAVFLVAGLILQLASLPTSDIKEFIGDGSPVDVYQTQLKKTNEEKAVSYLPQELFALGDDYYIRTGKGSVYGYLQKTEVTTNDAGEEIETVSYVKGESYRKTRQVVGGENIVAVLDQSGNLSVTGAFEYLTYEKNDAYFREELFAKDCSFAAGNENSLFYVDKGALYSLGYNSFGRLGDGTVRNRLTASKILDNVATVSTGETHTLAVDVYGNLYGFGDNSFSEMGNRTTAASTTPIKLMDGVKQAEAGRYFSVVLTKNGEVYTAGRNDLGQLGTGDDRDYATYMKILEGVTKISVNKNSCAALTANGTLYVWGDNSLHQLGAGEAAIRKPTQLATDIYDVAMGSNSMGMIRHNRDVAVTGNARPVADNEFVQPIWQFDATVPESQLYRETVLMPTRPQ
ncbi:MAG: hypothetical protein IJP27_06260 [Clostridia bacterium]|nr:hypothetical protein [Clostridia bacterium]